MYPDERVLGLGLVVDAVQKLQDDVLHINRDLELEAASEVLDDVEEDGVGERHDLGHIGGGTLDNVANEVGLEEVDELFAGDEHVARPLDQVGNDVEEGYL